MRTNAITEWKSTVEAHHEQSIRAQTRTGWSQADFWQNVASFLEADPNRTGDPILERVLQEVTSDTTVLDVGGGTGRLALPLAMRCREVTVVEPSPAMLERLEDSARQLDLGNIASVSAKWEEASVDPADIALCAHVMYGVTDIDEFIQKLTQHARQRSLVLTFFESPPTRFAPFWERVHGEERKNLPGLPALMNVLWEMQIYPDIEMFEASPPQSVPDFDTALKLLRHFLFIRPETELDDRLKLAMNELLIESPEGLITHGAKPRREALLSWRTG